MATILLTDDDTHTVRVMALWLGRHGHRTVEARTGAAALERLRAERVDMLITDVNMPELDGVALVEAVRKELELDIPVIVLSSRCDQASLAARLAPLGVEVFPKPFVPSRLVTDIERLLSGACGAPQR